MARIETHAIAVEPEWVQPTEIVEAAVRKAGQAVRGRPLLIEGGADRMFVRIDPRLTTVAVAQLLENAAHYSPPGTPINVRSSVLSGELTITVQDRGPGIPPQDVPRLFESFYRGANARQHVAGTGMGLAIARGLLAAQGGRVEGRNAPEGGAVFTIAAPAESRTEIALDEETE
jgi:two-component system sensor histidine kinase KdpD